MDTVHGLYRIKLVLKNPYLLKATTYIPPTFETRVQQAYSALPVSARIPKSLLPPGWNEDYRNATNHDLYILYKLWHARLLYQSPDSLRKLEKGGLLKGFAVPLYPEGSCPCITCAVYYSGFVLIIILVLWLLNVWCIRVKPRRHLWTRFCCSTPSYLREASDMS